MASAFGKFTKFGKLIWTMHLVQIVALTCTKLSCLFFYRRIFVTGQNRIFHIVTWALIAFISLWGLTFFIAILFQCNGQFSAWWQTIHSLSQHCTHALNIELAYAVTDFVTDFAVIVAPIIPVDYFPLDQPRFKLIATDNEAHHVPGSKAGRTSNLLSRRPVRPRRYPANLN